MCGSTVLRVVKTGVVHHHGAFFHWLWAFFVDVTQIARNGKSPNAPLNYSSGSTQPSNIKR